MTLRELQYLQAVARTGHFGQAAAQCHVSQPTLSVQLRKLEAELGVMLIERTRRGARLTETGEAVLALADQALDSVASIRAVAGAARDPFAGGFVFGSIPTIAPFFVPGAMRGLARDYPRLRLGFREDITERLTEDLLEGALDAAILATPPETPRLTAIDLVDDALLVICPPDHDLAARPRLDVSDLPLDQLILLSEGHCFRDQTVDLCNLDDARMRVETRVTSLETIISLVAAGQGISIIPAMAARNDRLINADVKIATLDSPAAHRTLNLTFRSTTTRRPLLEAVAETLREVLA